MVSPVVPQPDPINYAVCLGVFLLYSRLQGNLSLPRFPNADSGMSENANKRIIELARWKSSSRLQEMQQIKWRREQICKRKVGKIGLLLSAKQPQSYLYCTISTAHLMIMNKAFRLLSI